MNNLWQNVLGFLASIGVSAGLIVAVVKFFGENIAKHLAKRYENQLAKEFEEYKKSLENKNYISKVRFDTEFAIYKDLSTAVINMVFKNEMLFPIADSVPKNEAERKELFKKRYAEAVQAFDIANKSITSNAAFIQENIYKLFTSIRNKCQKQLLNYNLCEIYGPSDDSKLRLAPYDLSVEISKDLDSLLNELRAYLNSLDIL